MAKERCDTEGLIRYIGKTYIRYKRILEVEKISDAEEYLHLCYHYSFKIKVSNTNEVISVANEVDKSIVSLRIRGACSNSIYNAARKLTGNIGVHFSREDAINVLQEANELITLRVAADAIDTALSIHFSRVKATKSVSVKKVVVESVEKALDLIKGVNNGVCILKAPTGSGKTNKVLQLLYEEHSEYCTYIVHRRSIARSVMLDMSHYQDDVLPFKESSIRALRIVVNSLIKENLKKITNKASLLLVDEAQQTLNHVVSCRLGDESDRELIYNEFLERCFCLSG